MKSQEEANQTSKIEQKSLMLGDCCTGLEQAEAWLLHWLRVSAHMSDILSCTFNSNLVSK